MKKIAILALSLILVSCENSKQEGQNIKQWKEEIPMSQKNSIPESLYRIVSPKQWEESQQQKEIVNSAIDKDFIHLATEEQLPRIAQKFWNHQDHIILKLASQKLIGRLVYEANPGGTTRYYHLYEGNVPLDAVLEATNVPAKHN